MRQVQLHEEEHQFAALIAQAEAGEILTMLPGNKPVAQIIPFPERRSSKSAAKKTGR